MMTEMVKTFIQNWGFKNNAEWTKTIGEKPEKINNFFHLVENEGPKTQINKIYNLNEKFKN